MTKVIGVRFRQAGKIYFFAPGKYEDIETGQHVIVETARGVEYGHVVLGIREVEDKKVIQPLRQSSGLQRRRMMSGKQETAGRKKKPFRFVWKRLQSTSWK